MKSKYHKMKHQGIYLLVLSFLLFTCKEDEIVENKPGYFTLSQIKYPSEGRISSTSVEATDFDLGDLKASREFYFLLGNAGETSITDINLTTDNPKFILSPTSIGSIDGTKSGTSNIIPLVSLGVIHGVQLNGVGFTELLEMGEHSSVITITGKTIENGVTIDLKSEFRVKVNAKKVDIVLTDSENGNEIDFLAPDWWGDGYLGIGGIGMLTGYNIASNKLAVKNVGNVNINVTEKSPYFDDPATEREIAPGQTSEITLAAHPDHPDFPDANTTIFSIDGNGTMADYNRFQIGNDGKIYFAIMYRY